MSWEHGVLSLQPLGSGHPSQPTKHYPKNLQEERGGLLAGSTQNLFFLEFLNGVMPRDCSSQNSFCIWYLQ